MALSSVLLFYLAQALAPEPSRPHLHAVRVDSGPVIDGKLDDEVWRRAEPAEGFRQQVPVDGVPPSETTSVRMIYDDNAIYVGVHCEQRNTPIVGHLIPRDSDSESDGVSIFLDTRGEGKDAFWMSVNVSGSQADGTVYDQHVVSTEWDENWEVKTAVEDQSWTAEFKVPFRALRFPTVLPVQSWGIQVVRYIAAKQEVDQWAHVPRDNANWVANYGRLDGVAQVKSGTTLELRPFGLTRIEGQSASAGNVEQGRGWKVSGGLDLRLHLSDSLTLDAAVEPDFTQVEADQLVLNLTNYETFLPEKRALFVEGSDIFATPMQSSLLFGSTNVFPNQTFYSRRIGSPPPPPTLRQDAMVTERLLQTPQPSPIYVATKMIQSAANGWSFGALSALKGKNEVTSEDVNSSARFTRTIDPMSVFNVVRAKRTYGGSHLGMLATTVTRLGDTGGDAMPVGTMRLCASGAAVPSTGRCFRDAYVGAADGLWRSPGGEYQLAGQLTGSLIENGPPTINPDGTTVGSGNFGGGAWVRAAREGGRHVLSLVEYTGATTKLDYNDAGYLARGNLHMLRSTIAYRTLDPGAVTLETYSALSATANWNVAGLDLGQTLGVSTHARFRNFWTATASLTGAPARFDDREIGDGAALQRPTYAMLHLDGGTDPRQPFVVSAVVEGTRTTAGNGALAQVGALLHLLPRLDVELDPRLTYTQGEVRYAPGAMTPGGDYIFGRLRASSASVILQATLLFTPRLSLRAYSQLFVAAGHYTDFQSSPRVPSGTPIYLSDLMPVATPATNPDFEQGALNANVVLRWEYRLGSTINLVYSRSQAPEVSILPGQTASLTTSAILKSQAVDLVLLKANFWWAY